MLLIGTGSSVARGGGGGSSPPHWLVKYAKSYVFGAFEAIFCQKLKIAPPHRNTAPSNVWNSVFGWKISLNFVKTFFFLETTWFWAEKPLEFPISAEKSASISVKTFFLGGGTTWFRVEKTFELPSFPRNSVLISGQTVRNWFKNNENSGQGRLYFSHSFKIAPPFSKPWLRAWLQVP